MGEMASGAGTGAGLEKGFVGRYSRQVMTPEIGLDGQMRLQRSSVLLVGAGGLGSPCGLYLAGAGVGTIGIVDHDVVEVSNLHRQIIHSEVTVGRRKAESAAEACQRLNSSIVVHPHPVRFDKTTAVDLVGRYDIVADCSDNPATRYLINDVCVALNKPLVSASALRMEGQLTVYTGGSTGPCYRCIFSSPPPAETLLSCSSAGVLGVVPGVMGSLQALEVIKVIIGSPTLIGKLLLFDATTMAFRTVKLRNAKASCVCCGVSAEERLKLVSDTDYLTFTHTCSMGDGYNEEKEALRILPLSQRISSIDFYQRYYKNATDERFFLIDVRPRSMFDMCRIAKSENYPFDELEKSSDDPAGETIADKLVAKIEEKWKKGVDVFFVCRRGNDSQLAVSLLNKRMMTTMTTTTMGKTTTTGGGGGEERILRDLIGGLMHWSRDVDKDFPVY